MAYWRWNMADPSGTMRTIVVDGQIASSVFSYKDGDHPEVSYWIGTQYWGRGIPT